MTEQNNLKAVVYGRLEAIAQAEKITRVELRALSRELLMYVPDTHDIDIVNRLIGVLTPVNRKVAILYFSHFLPWDVEKDADGVFVRFGKMNKQEKQVKRKIDLIAEFLADDSNNIWTWGDDNIEIKKKDFRGNITKAVEKALDGDEKSDTPALTPMQVIESVIAGGITAGQLVDMMADLTMPAELVTRHDDVDVPAATEPLAEAA